MKNYYEELEVSKNASDEIISRAYKVLAKKYHPDTTKEDKQIAEEHFKKISEAYEVLSNKQKREEYDKTLPTDIDADKFNKILQDNRKLSEELLKVKSELDSIRLTKNTYNNSSISNKNVNNHTTNNTSYNSNNKSPNYNTNNYTYTEPRQYRNYTFLDKIKLKLIELFKKVIAVFLTICILFIAFGILYAIPSTRDFLINDLQLGILFKIFK